MKAKTPIKILTVLLFASLVSGYTLYKGGYLFSEENNSNYFSDPNGGTGIKVKSFSKEKFGLSTFQKLKMEHVFDPESFDAAYYAPVTYSEDHFLSSSKSMLVSDRHAFYKQRANLFDSFLTILLNEQFDTIQPLKK